MAVDRFWITGLGYLQEVSQCHWQCLKVALLCLPVAESLPSAEEMKKLIWLFGCPLLLDDVAQESWLISGSSDLLLEVGPRQASLLGQAPSMFQAHDLFQTHCPPLPLPFFHFFLL